MKSYVCITAGEWRNLCSMGRIRLQEARTVSTIEQLSPESYDLLFALAADRFLLGETSDFLIAEYKSLREEIEGIQPPGYEIGIRWLLLQDVIRFFPLRADDSWAFEPDALKARVALGEAVFETQWKQWFSDQLADQACINGLILRRSLGFGHSSNLHEVGSVSWSTLARQIIASDAEGSDVADFSTKFMRSCDRLFDLVREDVDSGAFFISCPIEWINLRSDINIFESDTALAVQAQILHEKYLNVAFEPLLACVDDIKEFETLLLAKAQESFPGAWRPTMISLYVRYRHKIRFGSPTPEEIIASVRAIDTPDYRRPAEMLAFLFGVALDANKTHSLERLLDPKRFEMVNAPAAEATTAQSLPSTEIGQSPVGHSEIRLSDIKISRIKEAALRDILDELHIFTFAEDGFSPLDIHARRFGLDSEQVRAFAKVVNDQGDIGSLHPLAPISAVPRDLVREKQDVGALAASISNFLQANRETIKARRLVFDFRTPVVPPFAIEALDAAVQASGEPPLEEVLILEM